MKIIIKKNNNIFITIWDLDHLIENLKQYDINEYELREQISNPYIHF